MSKLYYFIHTYLFSVQINPSRRLGVIASLLFRRSDHAIMSELLRKKPAMTQTLTYYKLPDWTFSNIVSIIMLTNCQSLNADASKYADNSEYSSSINPRKSDLKNRAGPLT